MNTESDNFGNFMAVKPLATEISWALTMTSHKPQVQDRHYFKDISRHALIV